MNRRTMMGLFTVASLVAGDWAVVASAQTVGAPQTPKNWSYQVDQRGNRVGRDNRIVRPDGSWREELRQGNCITVKERSSTGEYRETRQCNTASPK